MSLINHSRRRVAVAMTSLCLASSTFAGELLHPLFQDHAVLQRDRSVRIWGDADPGAELVVAIGDAEVPSATSTTIAIFLQCPSRCGFRSEENCLLILLAAGDWLCQ